MKKLLVCGLALIAIGSLRAQQKEGKIIYDRTVQMQIMMNNGNGDNPIQQSRTNKFELSFANNQMSWRQMEEEMQDDNMASGGMVIRTFGGGVDDITFCDFTNARKVEQRDFLEKKFLVIDSIRRGTWKLSDETKTILNHTCRKATSTRMGKRMQMSMENGKMERKEVDDTTNIIAWFTTDIPVPVGPETQGQLPGAILELETNNGRTVYKAVEIKEKPDLSSIKEPTKGKKVTPQEFNTERNKMLEEMQKNGGGTIRIRGN